MPTPAHSPAHPDRRARVGRWSALFAGLVLLAPFTCAQPSDPREIAEPSPETLKHFGLDKASDKGDQRPLEVRGLEIQNKLGDRIPLDLTFATPEGKTVKLAEYFNRSSPDGKFKKPVVMMMVYYKCPILCPMVLEKFTDALNAIDFTVGTEFDALVVSFDARDTPADAVARRGGQLLYYKQPTTDSMRDGFNFLTCSAAPENARALADALGFPYRYFPNTGEFSHGAAVFVLTPEGKVSRYILGMTYTPKDVRLALLEASQGKIGNLFDAFTLWCYHYDPNTGSYALMAMRVMRVGGALTAIVLGSLIFGLFRWERRRRRRLLAPAAQPASVSAPLASASAPASKELLPATPVSSFPVSPRPTNLTPSGSAR